MDEDDEIEPEEYCPPHRLTVADFLGVFFCFVGNLFAAPAAAAHTWGELLAGHSLWREERKDFEDEARLEIEALDRE